MISSALMFSSPPDALALVLIAAPINWSASATAWAGFLYVSVLSGFLSFFTWTGAWRSTASPHQLRCRCCSRSCSPLAAAWGLQDERIGSLEVVFAALVGSH